VAIDAGLSPRECISNLWSMQARKLIRFTSKDKCCYAIVNQDLIPQGFHDFLENLNTKILDRLQKLENVKVLKLDEVITLVLMVFSSMKYF
jgi:hypothetical protein